MGTFISLSLLFCLPWCLLQSLLSIFLKLVSAGKQAKHQMNTCHFSIYLYSRLSSETSMKQNLQNTLHFSLAPINFISVIFSHCTTSYKWSNRFKKASFIFFSLSRQCIQYPSIALPQNFYNKSNCALWN